MSVRAIKTSEIQTLNEKSGFVQVNKSVLDLIKTLDIGIAERYVLEHLFICAWDVKGLIESKSDTPQVFKSNSLLSTELNMTEVYIVKIKNKLIKAGFLKQVLVSPTRGTLLRITLPHFKIKQIERLKHIKRNQSKPKPVLIPEKANVGERLIQTQKSLTDRILNLNQEKSVLRKSIVELKNANSREYQTLLPGSLKAKERIPQINAKLTSLNEKLYQLQKESIDSREKFGDLQETQESKINASKRPKIVHGAFISKDHVKAIMDKLKALGVSPPKEYCNQIMWSIRYGYHYQNGYKTEHAINSAIRMIMDGKWYTPENKVNGAKYNPDLMKGLMESHLKSLAN